MVKIIYRDAVFSDLKQLVALRVLMQTEVNSAKAPQIPANFVPSCDEYFSKSMTDSSYYSAVAELDGRLVSTNGLVIYQKPPALGSMGGLVGYVTNVFTLPEHRGKGIAGNLMKLLIQFAKNNKVAKLHLGTTSSGKHVYEKAGFKPVVFEALELRL